MKKVFLFIPLFMLLTVIGSSVSAKEKYQPIDSSEYKFDLKVKGNIRWDKDGNITDSPTIGAFTCRGEKIELLSDKIEDNFILTKDYGKIKVKGGFSGITLYLTQSQKIKFKKLLKSN